MSTVTKSDGGEKCPKCGERLTRVHYTFDPFPGEHSGLHESQTTIGCPKCGWQKHESHHQDYDPYNPNRPDSGPTDLGKESFQI